MARFLRYLTHPQVNMDPDTPVPQWSLSSEGRARVTALADSNVLLPTEFIYSSDETKALETAGMLAESSFAKVMIRAQMGENDRSATGYLAPAAFEDHADAFFRAPDKSINGWETAAAAQTRIVKAVQSAITEAPFGNLLFIGHGGVGTLLYCALAGVPIDRKYDQGPGGGGNFITLDGNTLKPTHHWRPLEALIDG